MEALAARHTWDTAALDHLGLYRRLPRTGR